MSDLDHTVIRPMHLDTPFTGVAVENLNLLVGIGRDAIVVELPPDDAERLALLLLLGVKAAAQRTRLTAEASDRLEGTVGHAQGCSVLPMSWGMTRRYPG